MNTMHKRASGFTLVELMITIGIASILLGLVAPGMASLLERNRVQTATPQLPPQVTAQGVTVQQTATSYLLVYNLTSTKGHFNIGRSNYNYWDQANMVA